MALTPTQLATLKAHIDGDGTLSAFPNDNDGAFAIAEIMNLPASPDYWVWRKSISRSEVYHEISPAGTSWDWSTYKAQSQGEQGAWTQMFMGDAGPIERVNFRAGVLAIFSGTGAQATQRAHVFAAGRRKATRLEKLLAIAVVSPPANTGNDTVQARGSAANPDNLGFDGPITFEDVSEARNLTD